MVLRPNIRGMPENMVYRVLMCMWPFGALNNAQAQTAAAEVCRLLNEQRNGWLLLSNSISRAI